MASSIFRSAMTTPRETAMQLTPSQAQRAFVPLVALAMSGVMSLILPAFNLGIGPGFVAIWLKSWALAFAFALPTALCVVPLIRNGLARVTVPSSSVHSPSPPRTDTKPWPALPVDPAKP